MPSDFGEGWVSSPVEKWMIVLLESGVLVWVGGFIAWGYDLTALAWRPGFAPAEFLQKFMDTQISPVQALLLIFVLLVILALIARIVKRFDLFVLRALEGYWPLCIRLRCVKWQDKAVKEKRKNIDELEDKKRTRMLTPKEEIKHAELDSEFVYIPSRLNDRMPTRLGNILSSVEVYPRVRYGLDAFVFWPRLWLLLPEEVKQELIRARYNLDVSVRIWTWSILFTIWGIWAPLAAPTGLFISLFAYRWIMQAAKVYGQLVKSAFDLYRFSLYESLHWTFPDNLENEREEGERLTNFLYRGFIEKSCQNSTSKIIIPPTWNKKAEN